MGKSKNYGAIDYDPNMAHTKFKKNKETTQLDIKKWTKTSDLTTKGSRKVRKAYCNRTKVEGGRLCLQKD